MFETQAAHSLPDALVSWNRPRVEAFEVSLPRLTRKEGCRMNLTELLTLLMVILSLLGLIVDVIRLTIEVAEKLPQRNNEDSKKD